MRTAGYPMQAKVGATWRWLAALLLFAAAAPAAAQITFVGAGDQVANDAAGSLTPVIPTGTAAGDLAVLVIAGRPTDTALPGAPTGWTTRSSVLFEMGTRDLRLVTYYRVLAGGDANPSIALPGTWVTTGSNTGGMSAQIAVWRGVDTTTPFDVVDTTGSNAAAATYTPPAITTVNANALAVSVIATGDNNNLQLNVANAFAVRMGGTEYDANVGADHAIGVADVVQAAAGTVTMPQWREQSGASDPWTAITFALRRYVPPPPTQRLSFSFEEASWNGAAGQVVDDSTFGLNGRAFGSATTANTTPAVSTNPGTCRYGSFDGVDDYVEVADNAMLDITTELTVAAWIYMRTTPSELHTIVSKDTNFEYHIDSNRRVYWWWNDSSGNTRSITTTSSISLNTWAHVAVTYASGTQRLYINGVLQGTTGGYTGTLATNALPLYVGTDYNLISRAFDGYIDEVRVYADELSQSAVQALQAETHPCADSARFTITHNAFGINCVPETITVNVVDAVAGTPLLNYNSAVQLDALTPTGGSTGFGTWALVAGSGTLSDGTPGDGTATYTWPLGQSQATFTLYYPQGESSIDVDVSQISNNTIRDNDAEGLLAFYPNGFTVTAAALANPPGTITQFATNQTAGTDFTLYLAAYGQTPTDPVCGIIETYTGARNVKFWSQYVDPSTGTRNATINGIAAAASEGASVAQPVTFTNGQASVTAKYKDVGRIRIAMKDDTVVEAAELPSGIAGATANFVLRPYDFLLSGIANSANTQANPQATTASDAVFLAAGAPFRMTVTVRDAEGATTPNYGRESTPESVRLPTQIFAPSGGANPAIGSTVGFGTFANGVATGTDFTWSEVGIMRAVPGVGDGDYLAAGDVTGPVSEPIGRFIPARLVAALNAPLFTTQCAAGAFTYQGQPFGYTTAPVITATAVSVSGSTTTNYTGSFFKMTNTTLTGRSYSAVGSTLNESGLPATTVDPAIANPSGGVATLTFSAGSGISVVKSTPVAPFNAQVQLAIHVADSDGVVAVGTGPLGNPVTFGSSGGIAFNNTQQIRYGRARIGTAAGSELVDLAVPMRAEYYLSGAAGFVTNLQDTCSTNVSLSFTGYTESLNAGETCVRDSGSPGASAVGCAAVSASPFREPPVAGDLNLQLAAPGAGNQGSVSIRAAVPAWLRFDWDGGTAGDEEPTGQATFGIYGGERRMIYTREIY
jgi:MSHA biogenesis protein MshQ